MCGATSPSVRFIFHLGGLQSTPHMRGATRPHQRISAGGRYFNPRPTCVGRHWPVKTLKGEIKLQSTPHMRGATFYNFQHDRDRILLQSTPHMRGATSIGSSGGNGMHTSIHAPHAWGDYALAFPREFSRDFNPRPTCVGRPVLPNRRWQTRTTSIHAPHAWGDAILT